MKKICSKSLFLSLVFITILVISAVGCSETSNTKQGEMLEVLPTAVETDSQHIPEESDFVQETSTAWRESCPERYVDIWSAENITYKFDADVIVPNTNTIPLNRFKEKSIEQIHVDQAIKVFMNDRQVYTCKSVLTFMDQKQKMRYLMGSDAIKHQITNSPELFDESEQILKDYLNSVSERIVILQSELSDSLQDSAGEPLELLQANVGSLLQNEPLSVSAYMFAKNEFGYWDSLILYKNKLSNLSGSLAYDSYNPHVDYSMEEENMSFTRNLAIDKATQIIEQLGMNELYPVSVSFEAGYYTVYFGRVDEMLEYPAIVSGTGIPAEGFFEDNREEKYYLAGQENTYITLNEHHIQKAVISLDHDKAEAIDCIDLDQMMNFEEAISYYKNHFETSVQLRYEIDSLNDEDEIIINISEIRLLNLYKAHRDKLGNILYYESTPAWCFFGKFNKDQSYYEYLNDKYMDKKDALLLIGTVLADKSDSTFQFDENAMFFESVGLNDIIRNGRATYLLENFNYRK